MKAVAIKAYTEQAKSIPKGAKPWEPNRSPHAGKDLSSSYYQELHDSHPAYQGNNWLVDRVDDVLRCKPRSLLEVGCGNGKFLRAAAPKVSKLIGGDWAISPLTAGLPNNISIQRMDVVNDPLPAADLVCSADVLEHLDPSSVRFVIQKLHEAGAHNYHVIACYDDQHSHLTIIGPGEWLFLFTEMSVRYRIIDVQARRNDPEQIVCVIANF